MTKMIPVAVLALMLCGAALAADPAPPDPGVLPNSAWWRLDLASDRIAEVFQGNDRALQNLQERLAELDAIKEAPDFRSVDRSVHAVEAVADRAQNVSTELKIRTESARGLGAAVSVVAQQDGLTGQERSAAILDVIQDARTDKAAAARDAVAIRGRS